MILLKIYGIVVAKRRSSHIMKKLILKNSSRKTVFIYFFIFIILFLLCLLFPYSCDDWAWGSQIGLDRLSTWFENYSGRYFGNLIVIALTRSNFLKAFVMSFCITGIMMLIHKLSGEQKNGAFIILTVLLFMPVNLFRQVIVWTSGFSNYTTSAFLTLIYIYYVNNIYDKKKPQYSFLDIVPLAILGFLNTLIVEHMTIYNVILSVYVIIFTGIKFKKVYIQHIAYLVGAAAGTITMFSNSVYHSIVKGNDDYRSIGSNQGIIIKVLKTYFSSIVSEGFFNNFILNVFLVGVCLIAWLTMKNQNKVSKKVKLFCSISVFVMVAFLASTFIISMEDFTELFILKVIKGILTGMYILAFVVFLFLMPFENDQKVKLLFIYGSIGCMMVPLLAVSPLGDRCFFASYVMMLYLGMEIYSTFSESVKKKCEMLSKSALVTVFVGFMYLFYIYGTISLCNNERIEAAQAASKNGSAIVQVEELPYKKYVWTSDIDERMDSEKIWAERFKLFYNIDENVKIEQISSMKK